MVSKTISLSAEVSEFSEDALAAIKEAGVEGQITFTYEEPAKITIQTRNVRLVSFSLKEFLVHAGVPPQRVEANLSSLKTSVGRLTLNLQGEDVSVYAITLPQGFVPKNVKIEGAGEDSVWEYADNTLLLLIKFTSTVTVIVEFETVTSLILGFTASIIMLALVAAIIKPIVRKIAEKVKR